MKLLAVDYGTKRIGLAIGDTEDNIVVPFGLIENKGNSYILQELQKICFEETIEKIVVGVPLHRQMESRQEKITKEFAEFLKVNINMEVDTIDETFTSKAAEKNELYRDLYRDRSRGWKDAVAAAEILRAYMGIC